MMKSFGLDVSFESVDLSSELYSPLVETASAQLQLVVPVLLLLHSDQLVLLELPAVQGNYPDVVVLVELDVVDL